MGPGWRGLLLFLVCQSWVPRGHGAEPTAETQLRRGDSLTPREIETILEQILQLDIKEEEPTAESPLPIPESEEKTANSKATEEDTSLEEEEEEEEDDEIKQKEERKQVEEEQEEREQQIGQEEEPSETGDEQEESEDVFEEVSPPTTESPTSAMEDNFSYIFSRLSAIESAIHRLNVQFYGMDVKMSQFSQNLGKLRSKLDDTQDSVTAVSEMNTRNQRHIGQIEGCLKGRRAARRCYLFFRHFESYDTAQQLCQSRGGNLAMPVDQLEYAALAKYIHESLYPFNWPVWIGINDNRSEGMYLYENSHRVSFFNWYKDHLVSQPNGGVQENCVSISSDDGKWWDNDCTRRMYYVCEY